MLATPRSTVLALKGAKDRLEGDFRNFIINAWLGGLLSQADPKNYPKLESMIQGDRKKEVPADPAEASHNARLWGQWLQRENKKAGV